MPKATYTRRADGLYRYQLYIGVDAAGRKKYKSLYAHTIPELEKKIRAARSLMDAGQRLEAADQPFRMWAQRLMDLKEPDLSAAYYRGLVGRCRWWMERIGDVPVAKVLTSDLQDGITALSKAGRSKKTLTDYRNTAAAVLDLALHDRAIPANPAQWVTIPKAAPRSQRFALTAEERSWIDSTAHRAQTAAMVMMHAGLRRGELLALTWGDVDWQAGTVTVNKSVAFDGNTPVLKRGGKTDAATRSVPLDPVLREYLRPLSYAHSPLELIVPGSDGKPMTESAFTRMWDSYLAVLNEQHGQQLGQQKSRFSPGGIPMTIRNITPHTLRHTYATVLHAAGVDVLTAKEWLGHTDIRTTLSIYTHLDNLTRNADRAKLDAFFGDTLATGTAAQA